MTDAQLEELRYLWLFDGLVAQERTAKQEEALGHNKTAEAFRSYFVDRSGLTPEEAEAIKKIGAKYLADKESLAKQYRATLISARHVAPGGHATPSNSPELAAVTQQMDDLLPNTKAEIIAEIGPKAFTRLDSYMIHGSGLHASETSTAEEQERRQAQAPSGSN